MTPHHISSRQLYVLIFAILMALTGTTVSASFVNLGPLNTIVALTIAVTKAVLVILYFMHLRHSSHLTKLVVVAGFFWLAILLTLTLSDYFTRAWLEAPKGW